MVVFTPHQETPWTAFHSAVGHTKTIAALRVLLTLSCAVILSHACYSNEDCLVPRNCCDTSCPVRVSCDPPCGKDADCDVQIEGECVDEKCNWTCVLGANCTGRFLPFGRQKPLEKSPLCDVSECASFCQNGTCIWGVRQPGSDKDSQELGPMLLAIVAVAALLIFGCLFYCCLNQMKSDRLSVKIRMARRRERKAKQAALERSKLKESHNWGERFEGRFTAARKEGLAAIPEVDSEEETDDGGEGRV